jgi:predicted NACHT family NTPase
VEIPPTPLKKGGYKEDLRKRGNEEEEELVPPFSRGARGDLRQILNAGRALVLLDGLDEVRDADTSRVLRQIREFSQQFPQNQFVITCRIAAREYTFEQFTEVEIADFNDEQIADFSGKWFCSKNDPIKAERFLQKLEEDEPIRELATNPLLLTLLCLVFEDSGSFPTNRAELYQNGVDVLLKKWDVKRNIEREQVYKRLSLKRKEDLLSQIARNTFEAGNYFFKQREVERYISQYIQNLPDASTDPEALELDSVAVLKSIEAQHGLFVERARGIYSFSHLTVHEYFTARKIVTSCNPYGADDPTLQELVSHLTEKRWREVFLLTVNLLDSAEVLLRLMQAKIDSLLAEDEKLQQFLKWVDEKAQSVKILCKLAEGRAFYLAIENALFPTLSSKLNFYLDLSLPLSLNRELALYFTLDLHLSLTLGRIWSYVYTENGGYTIIIPQNATINLHLNNFPLDFPLPFNINYELQKELKNLKEQFHLLQVDLNTRYYQYRHENVQVLAEQLRAVMIEYRNIGHDWQFSDEQKQLLQQYYDANKLLVDCLNTDCYVSREVRQEIEETLLLPIAEIEKRQQRVL